MRGLTAADADSESGGSVYTPRSTSRAWQRSSPVARPTRRKSSRYNRRTCSKIPLVHDGPDQPDHDYYVGDSADSADDEDELGPAQAPVMKPKHERSSRQRCQEDRRTALPAMQSSKSLWFLRVEGESKIFSFCINWYRARPFTKSVHFYFDEEPRCLVGHDFCSPLSRSCPKLWATSSEYH